jgi:hypothetical protein
VTGGVRGVLAGVSITPPEQTKTVNEKKLEIKGFPAIKNVFAPNEQTEHVQPLFRRKRENSISRLEDL